MRSVEICGLTRRLVIRRWFDAPRGIALSPFSTGYAVSEALRDPVTRAQIGWLVEDLSCGAFPEDFAEVVRRMVGDGRLVLEELEPHGDPLSVPSSETTAGTEDEALSGPEAAVLDWIEIELVDDEGEPVPHETFELTLPDGERRRGSLDARGFRRVEGIPGGMCEVTFPNLFETEWSAA